MILAKVILKPSIKAVVALQPSMKVVVKAARGIPGQKGEKGDKGDQGEQGLKGDKGDQGVQGIPGPNAVSSDSNNYSTIGTDGKIFTPNPTKNTVGLNNVDNTADLDKPISNLTQTALSSKASITYVDNQISTAVVGLLKDRGNYDASSNLFPSAGGSGIIGAIKKGDLWTVSVNGTLGVVDVTVGDVVRALIDNPGQISANWVVTENNIGYVPENANNKATAIAGNESSNIKFPTIKSIVEWLSQSKILSILGIANLSGSNTGDETTASIRTKLGITTLSGNNTGDETKATIVTKLGYTPSQFLVKDTVPSAVLTNNVTNAILKSYLIPANTFSASDIFCLRSFKVYKNVTTGSVNMRVYINTSNTIPATPIAQFSMTFAMVFGSFERTWKIYNGRIYFPTVGNVTSSTDVTNSTIATETSIPIDVTVDNYFIIACQLSNVNDSIYSSETLISK